MASPLLCFHYYFTYVVNAGDMLMVFIIIVGYGHMGTAEVCLSVLV